MVLKSHDLWAVYCTDVLYPVLQQGELGRGIENRERVSVFTSTLVYLKQICYAKQQIIFSWAFFTLKFSELCSKGLCLIYFFTS